MSKVTRICKFCSKSFERWKSEKGLYCSKVCYNKAPKKPLTKEQNEALVERSKNYYKNASKEDLEKRWNNIGKAHKVYLTEEEIKKLEEILFLGYIKDKKMLMKVAGIENKSYKALNNHIEDNPEWWDQFTFFKEQLDWNVQKLKPDQFKELLFDISVKNAEWIEKKWDIGSKTERRLRIFYNIDRGYIKTFGQTHPEKVVETLLSELDILYDKEVNFRKSRFRVDFLLGNMTIIEVQGDYWHSNPKIYEYDKLTDTQFQNYYNDMFKREYLTNLGYKIVYIWEWDIKHDFEKVLNQILNIK